MTEPKSNLPISAPIARVSLEKQAKNGYSLETQINIMREINSKAGFATSEEHILVDAGFEGDDWSRPAINEGLELIRTGKVRGLTFLETDRFSRDMAGGLELIRKVREYGGDVILGDLGIVRDEANFQLMLHIKLAISTFQKASIKVKSRDATLTKVRKGDVHTSRAPYGYTYLNKANGSKIVVNEEHAKIVRMIFDWYDHGWSLRRIVRELEALAIPAPGRPRKDSVVARWSAGALSPIFDNEIYIGTWFYNKRRYVEPKIIRSTKPRHRKRVTAQLKDRSEWIPVPVEAIIDKALFDRCRARAAMNINSLGGRPSDRYLLKGLVFCTLAGCGCRMSGRRPRAQRRGAGYICANRDRVTGKQYCTNRVKADALEDLVWGESIAILADEPLLRRLLTEHDHKSGAGKAGDRDLLKLRIDELFHMELRYRADSGRVSGSKVVEIRQHYDKLIRETVAQRESLELELAKRTPVGERVDVGALVAAVRRKAENATRLQRQELLNRWVARVEYDGGEVIIHLLIPLKGANAQNCPGDQANPNSFAHLTITRRLAA